MFLFLVAVVVVVGWLAGPVIATLAGVVMGLGLLLMRDE